MTNRTLNLFQTPAPILALMLAGCGTSAPTGDAEPVVTVETAKIERGNIARWTDAFGQISALPPGAGDTGGLARLAAPTATIVREILVREGQSVSKGTLIARLDDAVPGAQLAQASADMAAARERVSRQEQLFQVGGIDRNTLDVSRMQLVTARSALELARLGVTRSRLYAPISGTVSRLYVQVGQPVDPSMPVADIVNGGRISLEVTVPAGEASSLAVGQPVRLKAAGSVPAPEGAEGKVTYVAPAVDPMTGTVLVRATVSNALHLLQGQIVNAAIETGRGEGRLIVPRSALYTDHDGKSSLVLVKDGKAHRVPVTLGIVEGERAEIEGAGLNAGQTIVTTGSYALQEGTKLQVASTKQVPTR